MVQGLESSRWDGVPEPERRRTGGGRLRRSLVLAAGAAGLLIACATRNSDDDTTSLPAARPPGSTIEFGHGGGMRPVWFSMTLGEERCRYGYGEGRFEGGFEFTLASGELDRLYAVLRANRLDRIRLTSESAHDRAGHHVGLSWKAGGVRVDESGGEIAPRWRGEWGAIVRALLAVRAPQVEQRLIDLPLDIGPGLLDRQFSVALGEGRSIHRPATTPAQAEARFRVLPGPYPVRVQVRRREGESEGSRVTGDFLFGEGRVEAAAGVTLAVDLRGGAVVVSQKR